MSKTRYTINGTRNLVTEAADALEGLVEQLLEGEELCEFKMAENDVISAIVSYENDSLVLGFKTIVWNGSCWEDE